MSAEIMTTSPSNGDPVTRPTSVLMNGNRLVDVQWKFGVTAASSENSSVGTTFFQLKLVIRKGAASDGGSGNSVIENVYMELTLPQFYSFLHEMERAKASMDHLK